MEDGHDERKEAYIQCTGVWSIGAILVCILRVPPASRSSSRVTRPGLRLPMSFSKVEYYEGCLKAQRSTGKVDRTKVWGTGNHMIGPDYEFRCYPTSLQSFNQRLSVWSRSSLVDAGSSLNLDISFQSVRPASGRRARARAAAASARRAGPGTSSCRPSSASSTRTWRSTLRASSRPRRSTRSRTRRRSSASTSPAAGAFF